ncbi:hypothetical protein HNP52_002598 [Sphingomonas kyeonggiensis]|uniref:Uncharacterized protein n=1 Tax=Sphingomonas kyeonggiensis TaxID=1268553 RepID=A0A7W7K215_9SPHN|nr:hypothetical protein [Sphingomonas kyeonggiensis]MBB4839529.1 hypothetical protein [Sphingomonas kyeonggiensis]
MRTSFPLGRVIGGVLLAALAASLVLSIPFGTFGLVVFPIAYLPTAMIGALVALPLYWLLHRFGIQRGWIAPLAGLLAGIGGMFWLDDPFASHPLVATPYWYAAAGIAGGCAFWWRMRSSLPPAAQ